MVAVPNITPVTAPLVELMLMFVLLRLHTPPGGLADCAAVAPAHTVAAPSTGVGAVFTVISLVA